MGDCGVQGQRVARRMRRFSRGSGIIDPDFGLGGHWSQLTGSVVGWNVKVTVQSPADANARFTRLKTNQISIYHTGSELVVTTREVSWLHQKDS